MGDFENARRFQRLGTHLRGSVEAGGLTHVVTVLSLSVGGFYCEGQGLEDVGSDLRLALDLPGGETGWSPKAGGASDPSAFHFVAPAEVLYVDLAPHAVGVPGMVGLGGRFAGISERLLEGLREFLAREVRARGDWRLRGSLHLPMADVGVGGR